LSDTSEASTAPSPVGRLIDRLKVEPLDRDLFLGDPGPGSRRLFGGLVAAQSFMAAASTLDEQQRERPLHSVHAYFLRPGRYEAPIRFVVDRIRDGRSFTTRRVVAHQGGEAIFNLSASFARIEDGPSHQDDAPPSPLPESLAHHHGGGMQGSDPDRNPIEMRSNDAGLAPGDPIPPERIVWMRPRGPMPEDPTLHTALLVFASDRSLVSTAVRHLDEPRDAFRMASLDHALWLHRPVRFDDWLQFTSVSPIAHGARGLIFGSVFDSAGIRIASVAQEGLIRRRRG
jgi:acyl-CoA thioesterase-2